MPFRTEIDVRFGDCDPAGIVYYPTLYHYCHVAFEECWGGALGIPYPELVVGRRVGFPTVHVETDFVAPVRYGDRLEMTVSVGRVGASSVVFVFVGSVADRVCLRSAHTKVCVNLDTLDPLSIPDDLRAALEAVKG
jgi:YbgC/YbaW family acyl-CoA thioester hydrolase